MPARSCCFPAVLLAVCLALTSSASTQHARRPMTLVDLLNIPRISDPQISPDGKSLTFVLATADWTANQRVPRIWRISTDGTGLRQLVDDAGAYSARWSPDGSAIAFLLRGSVFVVPAAGGTPRQVSKRTGVADMS